MRVHRGGSPSLWFQVILLLLLGACREREEGVACLRVADTAAECPPPGSVDVEELSYPENCHHLREILPSGVPNAQPDMFDDGSAGCCYQVSVLEKRNCSE